MSENIKISIIIPVFNAEKYLSETLDSIICDKFIAKYPEKSEILLIDNGSTDNSDKIIKKYAKTCPAIKYLNCSEKGAAAVRNFGVRKSRGEYIWYIDSDDLIAKNAVHDLISAADKANADIVTFGIEQFWDTGRTFSFHAIKNTEEHWRKHFVRHGFGPWQIFIRRNLIMENNLFFPEGIIHEDMALMPAFAIFAKSATFIDRTLYHYRQHDNSVLHSGTWDKRQLDIFPALEFCYSLFEKSGKAEEYCAELEYYFIWNLLDDAARVFARFKDGKIGFIRSRKMLKQYFPHWRRNYYLCHKPLKTQLRMRLNYWNLNPKHWIA